MSAPKAAASATPADAAEREQALDVTRSFVVQAPAGSGKTGLLVLRFLALLARVDRPEAVLAITFTRKAAGEMRHRIVSALEDAAGRVEPPEDDFQRQGWEKARAVVERDRDKGWGLLGTPSRLQVFTIDSFCARIVSSTPLLSRLGSTPSVVEDPRTLYREAVRRTLAPAGRALLGEHLEVLLERYEMGLDRLEEQLVGMLARREQWREGALGHEQNEKAWVAQVEDALRRARTRELEGLAEGVEPGIVAMVHDLARASRAVAGADCPWPKLGEESRLPDSVTAWKEAAHLMLRSDGKLLRTARTNNDVVHRGDPDVKEKLKAVLDAIAELGEGAAEAWNRRLVTAQKLPARAAFAAEGRAALAAFLAVLRQAWAELWTVCRERREVDYPEIAMGAVAALRPSETLERLDARVEHVLVDEFQDTNVLQCALLRGLTSGWQEGDGRTLFLVGDPMQSIYRFRKAEVGLFLAARSNPRFLGGAPLVPLSLKVNFRSTSTLVDWVGRTFRVLLGDRDDAARSLVAFAPALPRPGAKEGPAVDYVMWGPAEAKTLDADIAEAAGLADWIAAETAARRESGEASSKSAPIAVLVRARTHAQPLLRALETRAPSVRVRAPGLDMLADRTTVIDLEALVRALLHPGDRLAWLAVLRSRQVGLSLADLVALVEPDVAACGSARRATPVPLLLADESALARVSDEGRRRIARMARVFDAARRDLAVRSVDVAVRAAWLRLGGPSGGPQATRTDALDAEAFFDLLAARSRGGTVDLDDLARALRDTEAPVDADAEVDVDVMTMHKAKGLEFDTVILPALGRRSGKNEIVPLAMETEPGDGRLTMMAPRAARGREDADSDKYDFLAEREKERGRNELLRLLYVATTRARRRLLLSAAAGRLKKDGDAAAGSLLAALAPALDVASAREAEAPASAAPARRTLLRFPQGRTLRLLAPSVAAQAVVSEKPSERPDLDVEGMAEDRTAAQVGTVYHAFAQRIAEEGPDAWNAARLRAEEAAVRHALRSEGVLAVALAEATERVLAALVATLEDEHGRWVLAPHEGARSEWAVTSWDGQRLTSAQIDRTFVDAGVRWVVDFKTGCLDEDGGGAQAETIAAKCEVYRPQLVRYAELLAALEPAGAPIRLGLYFPEWPAGLRWQDITEPR